MLLRHADKLGVDPGARGAGAQGPLFAYHTSAYAANVLYRIGGVVGVFEAEGGDYRSLGDLRAALAGRKALAADVGVLAASTPLRAPERRDFRPVPGSEVINRGVKVFVPWALHGEVAEWHFYPAGDDPAHILDEHWYLTHYHVQRQDYYQRPTYPLKAVNVAAADYGPGPLEDWISGALNLNGRNQYAWISAARLAEPFVYAAAPEKGGNPQTRTAAGEDLKSPQMHRSGPLIEAFFRTQPGHTGGVLVEKMGPAAGYCLAVNDKGGVTFTIKAQGASASIAGPSKVNDGRWHHVVAEADRPAAALALYIDGRKDAAGRGIGADATLANDADLYVGGTPQGRSLAGAIDFLRIARGTLADAKTTIEELYEWEFNGPFLRDFAGRPPAGPRRDAGALELAD
ncbi:MAG: LamG domain-containing protein [Planctomycetes bacterium]|nr:LamG domain-containing protein [Planctomycetota bacterium]